MRTAKSFQRFLSGTPINLAGPNWEYSFGPAKACRRLRFLSNERRFVGGYRRGPWRFYGIDPELAFRVFSGRDAAWG